MNDRKKIGEELLSLLNQFKNKQIIVEGKRDRKVLYSLNFKKIATLTQGIYETTEKLDEQEILILTDFDSEGI